MPHLQRATARQHPIATLVEWPLVLSLIWQESLRQSRTMFSEKLMSERSYGGYGSEACTASCRTGGVGRVRMSFSRGLAGRRPPRLEEDIESAFAMRVDHNGLGPLWRQD